MRLPLISRDYLGDIAASLIAFLKSKGIDNFESLQEKLNQRFSLDETSRFVDISLRSSDQLTNEFVISYVIPGAGIPIETRSNIDLGYQHIILKCFNEVKGYTPFTKDYYGNTIQQKVLMTSDFRAVRNELGRLRCPQ